MCRFCAGPAHSKPAHSNQHIFNKLVSFYSRKYNSPKHARVLEHTIKKKFNRGKTLNPARPKIDLIRRKGDLYYAPKTKQSNQTEN
jgi:hypothetical protein